MVGNAKAQHSVSGPGINPYIQDDHEISLRLKILIEQFDSDIQSVNQVFYYGAGCSNKHQIHRIGQVLNSFFPEAHFEIQSDLLGAARAVCGNSKGLVGILGTGSNACIYDGKVIQKQMVSLGFWLGDEGSGGYLGKLLLSNWLKGNFPKDYEAPFEEFSKMNKNNALDLVYKDPNPNKTIAALAPFAIQHKSDAFFKGLIMQSLAAFFEEIKTLTESELVLNYYFVGSLAKALEEELPACINQPGHKLVKVVANPSELLFNYHLV